MSPQNPVEPAVVPPVDPFGRLDLEVVDGAPWTMATDELGLVEAVDGLGQRVVVTVSFGADRGDSSFSSRRSEWRMARYWTPRSE
jgi:hypothetical protein